MTQVKLDPKTDRTDSDNEEIHYACMLKQPLIALCGIKLDGHEFTPGHEVSCVVCADLVKATEFCPHGGECCCE